MSRAGRAVCVTLNAAIDRTYYSEYLRIGQGNRVTRTIAQAGGKGNNVARAIHRLGGTVVSTGFVGGQNGRFIVDGLSREGICNDFCEVSGGESRVCLTIVSADQPSPTEIMEPGIHVTSEDVQRLSSKLQYLVGPDDVVIFSGSLPPGCSAEDLTNLISLAKQIGARVIVDTSGEALERAIESKPYAVKPNEQEAAVLVKSAQWELGTSRCNGHPLRRQVVRLHQRGVDFPIITLGANGAIACDAERIYEITPPGVAAINTVGSGDAFLGGFVYGMLECQDTVQTLALAAAAGAVNATRESAAAIDKAEVFRLAADVRIMSTRWP
ncbi:MAG: 1-phosphofructokinase family hexose kinase [Alicyclobacillus sp.]|nr:1-phosphofructokinase family hexose kinase [Alicyclobacillus sp.]